MKFITRDDFGPPLFTPHARRHSLNLMPDAMRRA